MHIAQLIIVNAADAEGAVSEANSHAVMHNNNWSDWSVTGGRWRDEFSKPEYCTYEGVSYCNNPPEEQPPETVGYVLRYGGNEKLFELKLKEYQSYRNQCIEKYESIYQGVTVDEIMGNKNKTFSHEEYVSKEYLKDPYWLMRYLELKAGMHPNNETSLQWVDEDGNGYYNPDVEQILVQAQIQPSFYWMVVVDFHF